jgi:hypothetical protein
VSVGTGLSADIGANEATARTRATVFGIDVWSDAPLAFLAGARAQATGRTLELSRRAGGIGALGWPSGAELISEQHEPDGAINFRIESHPDRGYLISGPRYGAQLVFPDGRQLVSVEGEDGWQASQRLLIAQGLPFVAVLRGLEVFHASAVVIDGHALALAGPSLAGKTSVAVELCREGASFLADDVLVLERDGDELLAHPGSPVVGIADVATDVAAEEGVLEERVLAADTRERIVQMITCVCPAPLTAIFFIDRRADGPARAEFAPLDGAGTLLAATFNFVLSTPGRLAGLLDVCALAAHQRVEIVRVGPGVGVRDLADAVAQRVGEQG